MQQPLWQSGQSYKHWSQTSPTCKIPISALDIAVSELFLVTADATRSGCVLKSGHRHWQPSSRAATRNACGCSNCRQLAGAADPQAAQQPAVRPSIGRSTEGPIRAFRQERGQAKAKGAYATACDEYASGRHGTDGSRAGGHAEQAGQAGPSAASTSSRCDAAATYLSSEHRSAQLWNTHCRRGHHVCCSGPGSCTCTHGGPCLGGCRAPCQ